LQQPINGDSLTLHVAALVLFAALLHASWNALVKGGRDKVLDSSMIALGASIISLCAIGFLPLPGWQIWPYMLASTAIHFAYYMLIAAAYRHGDIALAYPLMRGAAPLIVTGASMAVFGEAIPFAGLAGVAVISSGIFLMAFEARGDALKSAGFALANACVIAFYTLVDAHGARIANDPVSYTLWISILPPVPLYLYAFFKRGKQDIADHLRANWWKALIGGGGSVGAYSLALWAMTKAPVALVAALRETSILFALLISVLIFKENASRWRYIAGGMIAAGALILKLA
jgi:drug/metabolite transporter (DMT)-like permease